jgi:hypothetical protein
MEQHGAINKKSDKKRTRRKKTTMEREKQNIVQREVNIGKIMTAAMRYRLSVQGGREAVSVFLDQKEATVIFSSRLTAVTNCSM